MYLALKLIHVLAAIVFVGNTTVGVLWKAIGDKTRDPAIMAHTMSGIIRADRVFTIPAIIVLLMAGVGTAQVGHLSILGTGWILWGIALFVVAGIAFGPLSRTQREIAEVARAGATTGAMDWQRYEALSGRWAVLGSTALVTPLLAVACMVLKPALPAFHP
jgi:uncharacterized membrane protein